MVICCNKTIPQQEQEQQQQQQIQVYEACNRWSDVCTGGFSMGGGSPPSKPSKKTVDVSTTFRIINEHFVTMDIGRRTATRSTIRPVLQLIRIHTKVVQFNKVLRVVELAIKTIFFFSFYFLNYILLQVIRS